MAKFINEKPTNRIPKKSFWQNLSITAKTFLSFAISICGLSIFTWFWPELNLNTLDPLDPRNPFSNILELSNTAILPAYNVRPIIKVKKLISGGLTIEDVGLSNASNDVGRLGGRQTYTFNHKLESVLLKLDGPVIKICFIEVIIKYEYLFIDCTDTYYFECVKDYQNNWKWAKQPMPDESEATLPDSIQNRKTI